MQLNPATRSEPLRPALMTGWQERLDAAATSSDVVGVARDFVATITPEETALLPQDCRPAKIVDAQDISDFAFTVVRRSCEDEWLSDENVLRLATFFTRASLRLSQITAQMMVAEDDA